MSNLYLDIYKQICDERGWKTRKYIIETFQKLYKYLDKNEPRLLLLNLPTGYGKTSITEVILKTILTYPEELNYSRIIHVLPLKSIIHQLAVKLKREFGDAYVGEQHMGIHDSPYLVRKCVVTTFDTFLLNFVKLPTAEYEKALKYGITHYHFSRAMIYSSLVIFDEPHLIILSRGRNQNGGLSVLTAIISGLLSTGSQVILSTASLPTIIKEELINWLKAEFSRNIIDEVNYEDDPEFRSIYENRIEVATYEGGLKDLVKSDIKKTIIIFNRVIDAVKTFKEFIQDPNLTNKYDDILLLHGMLPEYIKMEAIDIIQEEIPDLVIATHSIEAGVDISYERIITVPVHPDSLIQRVGRVARRADQHGELIILSPDYLNKVFGDYWTGYYNRELSIQTFEYIETEFIGREVSKRDFAQKIGKFMDFPDISIYYDIKVNNNLYDIIKICDNYEIIYPKMVLEAFRIIKELSNGPIQCYPVNGDIIRNEYRLIIDEDKARNFLRKYNLFIRLNHGKLESIIDDKLLSLVMKDRNRDIPLTHLLIQSGYIGIGIPFNEIRTNYSPEELENVIKRIKGEIV